jgi:hypothetical protein
MKKAYGLVALPATLMTANIAAAAPTGIKNAVLVHSTFADDSGSDAVAVDL